MIDLTPLVFEPVIVPKPWGGRRPASLGKSLLGEDALYGESWELADLPAERVSGAPTSRTIVSRGPRAGMSLRSLIEELGSRLMGSVSPTEAGDFPLLLKILDARENLSIQVHPDDDYVATHTGCWRKTESWYVADADPGARLFLGFRDGVTFDQVQAAAATPAMADLMNLVPAIPGQFHHLPAGLVHALGGGVMVIEPQTPSDTTFRLYDWTYEYGRAARPLHLDEGLTAMIMDPPGVVALNAMHEDGDRQLIDTGYYWLREHKVTDGPVSLEPGSELRILMAVRGTITITGPGICFTEIPTGSTAVIPAAITEMVSVNAGGVTTVLETGLV